MKADAAKNQEASQRAKQGANSHATEPSFVDTFEGFEALLNAKLDRFDAIKTLFSAEAKLSFSAILLFIATSCMVLIVGMTIWILVNIAVGLVITHFGGMLWIAIITPLFLNILAILGLYRYLKYLHSLMGLRATLSSLGKEA
jgi:hypothetical protein